MSFAITHVDLQGLRYKGAYWQCLQGRSAASRIGFATDLPPQCSAGGCEEARAGGWARAAMRGSKVREGHMRRGVRVSACDVRTRAKVRQHMLVDTHDDLML